MCQRSGCKCITSSSLHPCCSSKFSYSYFVVVVVVWLAKLANSLPTHFAVHNIFIHSCEIACRIKAVRIRSSVGVQHFLCLLPHCCLQCTNVFKTSITQSVLLFAKIQIVQCGGDKLMLFYKSILSTLEMIFNSRQRHRYWYFDTDQPTLMQILEKDKNMRTGNIETPAIPHVCCLSRLTVKGSAASRSFTSVKRHMHRCWFGYSSMRYTHQLTFTHTHTHTHTNTHSSHTFNLQARVILPVCATWGTQISFEKQPSALMHRLRKLVRIHCKSMQLLPTTTAHNTPPREK